MNNHPNNENLEWLLEQFKKSPDKTLLFMIRHELDFMAKHIEEDLREDSEKES